MKSGRIVPQARSRVESIELHPQTRKRLERKCRKTNDARLRTRYLVVLRAADGWGRARIAEALGCGASTVRRVLERWRLLGEAGLVDRREDNGDAKADEEYARWVLWVLRSTPQEFLHRRTTWTRQLLIETVSLYTGKTVSVTTMGRLLKRLKVRRGRAKAVAPCPWPKARKQRRIQEIRDLVADLPADEACVWEDELDLHLNPKIGFDYMLPGTQRQVMTPGKNQKRYLAGAMDARTDKVLWVEAEKKDSRLFILLLKRLAREYPDKKVIHVVLDNYGIHDSRQARTWLKEMKQRKDSGECGAEFRLHFLPPYCPDDNRIERCVWRELHQNVTVNHRRDYIEQLAEDAADFIFRHNCRAAFRHRRNIKTMAAEPVSELRPAI